MSKGPLTLAFAVMFAVLTAGLVTGIVSVALKDPAASSGGTRTVANVSPGTNPSSIFTYDQFVAQQNPELANKQAAYQRNSYLLLTVLSVIVLVAGTVLMRAMPLHAAGLLLAVPLILSGSWGAHLVAAGLQGISPLSQFIGVVILWVLAMVAGQMISKSEGV